MEMFSLGYTEELKPDLEPVKVICRCCLSTDQQMLDVYQFSPLFLDFAGISISESDGLPRSICIECSVMLHKSLRFKRKLLRAHTVLYEYLTRCAPLPIDAQDPELSKYRSPVLSRAATLAFDSLAPPRGRPGFHPVLEHDKRHTSSSLGDVTAPEPRHPARDVIARANVKQEDLDDYEDNIPLEEYKTNIDSLTEEALARLLQDSDKIELKEELAEETRPARKKKKKREDRDRKRKKISEPGESAPPPAPSIRRPVDIDPNKIRIITLNPEEQVKQREEESKSEGHLKLPFKCSLCYKGFNFETKLRNHMHKHSPSRGKFECTLCRMYLPTPYSYSVHMLIHTRRYECLKCGRRMTDRASIVEHYRVQHEGVVTQYSCQLCGKISSNNKTHRGHMRNHHSGARPACDDCGKTFVNKDSLADHVLIHLGVKNYACGVCEKRFRTKTQVKHHQLKHSDAKEYYCVECDVRFKSAHNLRQHLLKSLKHKDSHSFKYGCSRCNKRFESEAALQRHVTVQHEGVRAHICNICGAALATRNSLAKHVRSHEGHRPAPRHVCHTCGRAFRGKSVLMNHVRTHTGEKPFECATCGRRFTQRTAMRTHVKLVHLKLKRNAKIKQATDVMLDLPETRQSDGKLAVAKDEPVFDWRLPNQEIYFTVNVP